MALNTNSPITEIEWVAMAEVVFDHPVILDRIPSRTVLYPGGGGRVGQDGIDLAISRGLLMIEDGGVGPCEPVLTPMGRLAVMAATRMSTNTLTVAALTDAIEASLSTADGPDRRDAALTHLAHAMAGRRDKGRLRLSA